MNNLQKYLSMSLLATSALLGSALPAWAQVSLGAASEFSVLGGTNVTCTAGVVTGDAGVFPGSAVPFTNTGCTIAGSTPPATNAAAAQARTAFLGAYAALRQSTSCTPMPGNLAGRDLAPGVYCVDAVAKAGTLTLTGPSNGVWIFLVNGALTGTNFSVVMAGGGQPCNVFWVPSGAATMTTSAFKGNILAGDPAIGSITLTGGTLAGRALANVAVTMTGASVIGCGTLSGSSSCNGKDRDADDEDNAHRKCNQGVGNGSEGCDPGHMRNPFGSNDERGGTPGNPGRKGGNK
jgi:hypothetical protein